MRRQLLLPTPRKRVARREGKGLVGEEIQDLFGGVVFGEPGGAGVGVVVYFIVVVGVIVGGGEGLGLGLGLGLGGFVGRGRRRDGRSGLFGGEVREGSRVVGFPALVYRVSLSLVFIFTKERSR